MVVLKMIAKILLVLVIAALTLIQWIGIFLNSISAVLLGILAFIFALIGIIGLAFGIVSGSEAVKMIATGFVIFMLPVIGEWIVDVIAAITVHICRFIKS